MLNIATRPKFWVFSERSYVNSMWPPIICLSINKLICSYSELQNLYLELFSCNVNQILIILFYVNHACYHTVLSDKLLKRFQFSLPCAALLSALLWTLLRIVFAVLLTVDFGILFALLWIQFLRNCSVLIPVWAQFSFGAISCQGKVSHGCIAKKFIHNTADVCKWKQFLI